MMEASPQRRRGAATSGTSRRVERAQNISRMCLVCGRDNQFGLHARFYELAPDESPRPRPQVTDRPAPTRPPAASSWASSACARSTRATRAACTAG